MTQQQAREALEDQGFKAPGPLLIQHVMDALAREQEGTPAGERVFRFDYAELLTDTPELIDRTEGPLTEAGTEMGRVVADVLSKALRYVLDDVDDS